MFYSKSTGGFYDREINGESIPDDAVEISDVDYSALIAEQSAGKIIRADQHGNPIAANPPVPNAASIWGVIQVERNRRTREGGYQVAGKWFHSDEFSRGQQLGLVLLGSNIPAGLQWKTMDGTFVTMTPTLAQQILGAAAASDTAIFAAAEVHKAAMEASTDPATYDFSGGWPKVFGEV